MTRDLLYDAATNKQFIHQLTAAATPFTLSLTMKPVDEDGEQYHTYFLNMVDEADLLAALEAAGGELPACSCTEKCAPGAHQYGLRGLRGQRDRVCWHSSRTRPGDGTCGGAEPGPGRKAIPGHFC